MDSPSPRPYIASLAYFIVASESFPTLGCLGCGGSLDVHQPDQDQAEQFLGTCSNCGRWYRVSFATAEADLIVLELPDAEQIDATPPSRDGAT